ncbi:sirohydrochlorin chelatase [Streptomyces ovatisporus]|uniref:Sirohydrochlorin chelatase n=1 Tax=Streptomyces ovatisporus TaxID=1128682 RepID=A0ABV8ZZM5_9ACTN
MTPSLPSHSRSRPGPRPFDGLGGLDSTAQLMTRLSTQLQTQLRSVRAPRPARVPRAQPPHAPVLVAAAHGSRDPRALRTVEALVASVRAMRPGLHVALGHVELNEPLLSGTLAALPAGRQAVVVPLLFGPGHHVDHDLPSAVADAPHVRARIAQPLGPHPLLAAALHDRLREAGWRDAAAAGPAGGPQPARCSPSDRPAVVLAAAGSRSPAAAAGAERTARQLRESLGGGVPVVPAYASAARPAVGEAVRALQADGHAQVAVASCFTAPGYFASLCAAQSPWIAAAPIGAHPALAGLVLHRYDEARAAPATAGSTPARAPSSAAPSVSVSAAAPAE